MQQIPLAAALLVGATVSAAAVPLEGVWTGMYGCAQGITPGEIFIRRAPTGSLDARFHFGDGTPARPEGCFAMIGAPDPDNLQLGPTHWFMQPFGYVAVSLAGSIHGPVYAGSVIGPGCTTFQFVWHPLAPLPPACR